ncbi:MAG: SirB2 family protein [Gammaproteobacteria bacterium]|nr:SirB2 family protein [Gammaproteobacteria bacterium]
MKTIHVTLALLTVVGFMLRAGWTFTAPDLLAQKWVRIAPHVIDTALLAFGVLLALNLAGGVMQPWLMAKMAGLLAYIGFGVLTMRGSGQLRVVGLLGALLSVGYVFSVAYSRAVFPWL